MKQLLSVVSALFLLTSVNAASGTEKLEKRVAELEKTVKKLQAQVSLLSRIETAKQEIIANRKKQQQKARARFKKDLKTYSRKELAEIEKLYQVANRKFKSPEAKKSLETLISKYAKANRTGCAVQYLGQMTKGEEQLHYLKLAISDFSDCYYGDGVQVGAYARFYLGFRYLKKGKKAEAGKLFKEILEKYPDAIDHRGNKLSKYITKYVK